MCEGANVGVFTNKHTNVCVNIYFSYSSLIDLYKWSSAMREARLFLKFEGNIFSIEKILKEQKQTPPPNHCFALGIEPQDFKTSIFRWND